MEYPFSLLAFLGALAIFMYGIRTSRHAIQLLAGDRFRSLITNLTQNRLSALGLGILLTLILQSSTATMIMLVGFAATGHITLTQAMGVMLGADIGTTVVVFLLSVRHFTESALLLLVVGVLLDIFSTRKKTRTLSMALIGFGFVFLGMNLMIKATAPLKDSPLLSILFSAMAENPHYAFFGAAVLTALVQNSATTLGLTLALSFSGLLDLKSAIPLVLGANVGSCAASLFYSFKDGLPAKRVAFSHLFFKASGALLALIFLGPLQNLILFLSHHFLSTEAVTSQVVLTHVVFNLMLAVLFLPFIKQGSWLMHKLVPEPLFPTEKKFGPKYLDRTALETPILAFANAKREILNMSEIASEMFLKVADVFEKNNEDLLAYIEEQDDKVDLLDRDIKFYLAKISQEALSPDQARKQLNLLAITSDLEEICDVINKNILELAQKKIRKNRQFSEEGWKEIKDFHLKIVENFQLMTSILAVEDLTLALKIARHEKHLEDLEDKYRESHLQRLHKGMKEAIETSSIHLDLLANFRRINSKLVAIVKATLPDKGIEAS